MKLFPLLLICALVAISMAHRDDDFDGDFDGRRIGLRSGRDDFGDKIDSLRQEEQFEIILQQVRRCNEFRDEDYNRIVRQIWLITSRFGVVGELVYDNLVQFILNVIRRTQCDCSRDNFGDTIFENIYEVLSSVLGISDLRECDNRRFGLLNLPDVVEQVVTLHQSRRHSSHGRLRGRNNIDDRITDLLTSEEQKIIIKQSINNCNKFDRSLHQGLINQVLSIVSGFGVRRRTGFPGLVNFILDVIFRTNCDCRRDDLASTVLDLVNNVVTSVLGIGSLRECDDRLFVSLDLEDVIRQILNQDKLRRSRHNDGVGSLGNKLPVNPLGLLSGALGNKLPVGALSGLIGQGLPFGDNLLNPGEKVGTKVGTKVGNTKQEMGKFNILTGQVGDGSSIDAQGNSLVRILSPDSLPFRDNLRNSGVKKVKQVGTKVGDTQQKMGSHGILNGQVGDGNDIRAHGNSLVRLF